MRKLFLLTICVISLYAEIPLEERVQVFSAFKSSNGENVAFGITNIINKKFNSIQEFSSASKKMQEKVAIELNNDKFDYIKAIKNMCQSILTVDGVNCPREIFTMAILQDNNCKKIEMQSSKELFAANGALLFESSDPFYNEDLCFVFAGTLHQRLDKDTALFMGDKGETYLLKLPKKRYTQGKQYLGVVRGNGNYKYTTILGASKTVPKGIVLSIK